MTPRACPECNGHPPRHADGCPVIERIIASVEGQAPEPWGPGRGVAGRVIIGPDHPQPPEDP